MRSPYLLTGLIERPGRLVYLSSGMHRGGDPGLTDPQWEHRPWNGPQAYADSNQKPRTAHPAARDVKIQDRLLSYCATLTGVTL
jgi:hypothetical protein